MDREAEEKTDEENNGMSRALKWGLGYMCERKRKEAEQRERAASYNSDELRGNSAHTAPRYVT